jgi:catalase-peroxidase
LGVPLQLFLNHKKHNIDMENNPMNAGAEAKCPFTGATAKAVQSAGGGTRNRDWWPNQLKLNILRQNSKLVQSNGCVF